MSQIKAAFMEKMDYVTFNESYWNRIQCDIPPLPKKILDFMEYKKTRITLSDLEQEFPFTKEIIRHEMDFLVQQGNIELAENKRNDQEETYRLLVGDEQENIYFSKYDDDSGAFSQYVDNSDESATNNEFLKTAINLFGGTLTDYDNRYPFDDASF